MTSIHQTVELQSRINNSIRALEAKVTYGSDSSLTSATQMGLYAYDDTSGAASWTRLSCDPSGFLDVNIGNVIPLTETIGDGSASLLQRSVIAGKTEAGSYINAGITTNGEVFTNTLASERKSYVGYVQSAIVADEYVLMVDLDNAGSQWPHSQNGSINVDSISAKAVFATVPGDATLRFGVITRIDGSNADLNYLQTYTLQTQGNDGQYIFHNFQPSCLPFKQAAGKSVGALTNDSESNVSAVNTATTLLSPGGSVAPGVGDIILKLQYHSDPYNVAVGMLYHSL
jgi:hypothetical protein